MTMTADVKEVAGKLAEFVRQVEAGHEVVLTRTEKPVAKLVPAPEKDLAPGAPLKFRSLKGHRVLTPVISQAELAEEMFERR